jgi:phage terminase large subunit GpA-like protein
MNAALSVLDAAILEAVRPDPLRSIVEWADACRVLDSMSPEPGRWRTSRTPYLREIMEALSPGSGIERVVVQAGAQVGKTEVGLNLVGHRIDDAPGPILIVQPRDSDAETFSKMRLKRMIDAAPTLKAKVADSRPGDGAGTLTLKEFPGGALKLTGAQAPAGLRSMPVCVVFGDELDAWADDCGGEGDPRELLDARTNAFGRRKKIYLCSTPTYAGHSKIEQEVEAGDKRRFWVPCPHCGGFQLLSWARITWPTGRPLEAYLECEHCKGKVENHHKEWMLPRGEWRPSKASTSPRIRSYILPSFYSPHGFISWGEIALKFLKAKGDPIRLRAVVNTLFGETWQAEGGAGLAVDAIMAARRGWGATLPAAVAVLTAGVDVQDDRLEVEIVGWGVGEESWSIEYRTLWGPPKTDPAVWAALDNLLDGTWPHALGGELPVAVTVIDTAGHCTDAAYAYVRTRSGKRRLGCVGRAGTRPVWNNRPRRNNKGKIPLFVVGTDAAKESIYGRLALIAAGPGYCHFPPDRDEEYFKGLTCERFERKVVRGIPRLEWTKPEGARNEPLDLRVYAYAALWAWYALGYRIEAAIDRQRSGADTRPRSRPAAPAPVPTAPSPKPEPKPAPRKRKAGWLSGGGGGGGGGGGPATGGAGWFNGYGRRA